MSTKLSTDMISSRSSTRLHAPPGGASSISFGDANTNQPAPAKANPPLPPSVPSEPKAPPVETAPRVDTRRPSLYGGSKSVVLVVAGKIGKDVINSSSIEALQRDPKHKVTLVSVDNAYILPYIVQKIIKQHTANVIVAVAVNVGVHDATLNTTIVPTLIQLGVTSGIPVIPSILQCENLLEVRALIPDFAKIWSISVDHVLEPVTPHDVAGVITVVPPVTDIDISKPDLTVDELIVDFRKSLQSHGATGIAGIARKFRIIDDDNSGLIDLAEFSKVVSEHALHWDDKHVKMLFDSFDKDHSSFISYDEFLVGLRGDLNDRRKQLVMLAFELYENCIIAYNTEAVTHDLPTFVQILDVDKSGGIQLNDILAKYDGSKHPDVITGKRTNNEILSEFLDTFDGNHDGTVTFKEFCEYYGNVSASIDLDDYFELVIRNAWHISGGVGWCANSTCRRVLVTHTDGRQTVEEIKNDLGIKAIDEKAIRQNLFDQGILDIASISLTNNASDEASKPTADAPSFITKATEGKAAGQRPAVVDITATKSNANRQAPGGKSSLVLG